MPNRIQGQGALLLPSKQAQTNGHKQVDAHASSRYPALPSVTLAGQLFTQGGNCLPKLPQHTLLHPAALTCCACCRVLRSAARGHRATMGEGHRGRGRSTGGRRREGKVSWTLEEQHSISAMLQVKPMQLEEPGGFAAAKHACSKPMRKQMAAHASSRSPALPCVMLAGQLIPQGFDCLPNGHSRPCCRQQNPPAWPAAGC
jgi:hypothetical protein